MKRNNSHYPTTKITITFLRLLTERRNSEDLVSNGREDYLFFLRLEVLDQKRQQLAEISRKMIKLDLTRITRSQHNVNPKQFERAAHPKMVKRTFWTNKATGKEYLREIFTDTVILLAEACSKDKDKFPENPKKKIIILDVFDNVAPVKLIADDWVDYMHIIKLDGDGNL